MSKAFTLGEQPTWAGEEAAVDPGDGFLDALLLAAPAQVLNERGYCIVRLGVRDATTYAAFHADWQSFCALPSADKEHFAQLQFDRDPGTYSPNQFHGYSRMHGLKEQFMLRAFGRGADADISTPQLLARQGFALYAQLDNLCRELCADAVTLLGLDEDVVAAVLDPEGPGDELLPPGYISSSIMDCFHYFPRNINNDNNSNNTDTIDDLDERYHNNHAMHTDSGLMTVVVCADTPGLEVLDPKLRQWVPLERLLHRRAARDSVSHRRFAVVFYSDSVEYLVKERRNKGDAAMPGPCYHRVARSDGDGDRFSVVFKQRTAPLATAARYQVTLAHARACVAFRLTACERTHRRTIRWQCCSWPPCSAPACGPTGASPKRCRRRVRPAAAAAAVAVFCLRRLWRFWAWRLWRCCGATNTRRLTD